MQDLQDEQMLRPSCSPLDFPKSHFPLTVQSVLRVGIRTAKMTVDTWTDKDGSITE